MVPPSSTGLPGVLNMASAAIHPVAKALPAYCRQLALAGLARGDAHSLSVRDDDLLWLTPPSARWETLQADSLLLLRADSAQPVGGLRGEDASAMGSLAAVWPWHQMVYALRPEAGCVLIVRAPYGLAVAMGLEPNEAEPVPVVLPGWNEPVWAVPSRPGGSLPGRVQQVWKTESACQLVVVPSIGVMVVGQSVMDAVQRVERFEAAAQVALFCPVRPSLL